MDIQIHQQTWAKGTSVTYTAQTPDPILEVTPNSLLPPGAELDITFCSKRKLVIKFSNLDLSSAQVKLPTAMVLNTSTQYLFKSQEKQQHKKFL
jgi:hypothetical protein